MRDRSGQTGRRLRRYYESQEGREAGRNERLTTPQGEGTLRGQLAQGGLALGQEWPTVVADAWSPEAAVDA